MSTTNAPADVVGFYLDALALDLGICKPAREVYGIPGRRYRFDYAFLDERVAVEYDGGTWRRLPSHSSPEHQDRDREKLVLAQLAGWLLIPVTSSMVRSGRAVELVEAALRRRMAGN